MEARIKELLAIRQLIGYLEVQEDSDICLVRDLSRLWAEQVQDYLSCELGSRVREGSSERSSGDGLKDITPRETAVLSALILGKSNKEIAGELFITESTVKYHICNLFSKMHVSNRTQAVRVAIEKGLTCE